MTQRITLAGMDKLAERIKAIEKSITELKNKVDNSIDKINLHFESIEKNDLKALVDLRKELNEVIDKLNNFDSSFEIICGDDKADNL